MVKQIVCIQVPRHGLVLVVRHPTLFVTNDCVCGNNTNEFVDITQYMNDFAQLGQAISVNFGFTKEKFTGADVDYDPSGTATLPSDVQGN